jgi:hypothetical protein
MELELVTVFTRDEYREAQEPIGFIWREKRYKIEQVVDRWYEGHKDPTRMPLRYFKVKTSDGDVFILRYHEFFRTWSILIPRDQS